MNKIFIQSEEVGKGLPILNKQGAIAKQLLIEYISRLLLCRGYIPTASPHIGNLSLFETSGHYPYYKESMFPLIETRKDDFGIDEQLVLKPMNCPFHIMSYKDLGVVSYRDLPIKIFEFGQVYRHEDTGAINGLFRCRSFTQDDGHIFCTMSQINESVRLIKHICERVGFKLSIKFSKKDPANTEKYVGGNDNWNAAEDILKSICFKQFGEAYAEEVGGAAFYGPKIDFIAKDSIGREWQLGTIQLDFNLSTRFNLSFIDDSGNKQVPVLIHRALLGSIERFLGVLNETGIPDWLNPFNVGIVDISTNNENNTYSYAVVDLMNSKNIYPTLVIKPKNLAGAIKKLHDDGIDNIVVIGNKEVSEDFITINNKPIQYGTSFDDWIRKFRLHDI